MLMITAEAILETSGLLQNKEISVTRQPIDKKFLMASQLCNK